MPHLPRQQRRSAAGYFHVMNRGHNREVVFQDAEDHTYFLHLLDCYCRRFVTPVVQLGRGDWRAGCLPVVHLRGDWRAGGRDQQRKRSASRIANPATANLVRRGNSWRIDDWGRLSSFLCAHRGAPGKRN